jgi:hypothetical protein
MKNKGKPMKDWASQENAGEAFEILVVAESIVAVIIIASAIFIAVFWRRKSAQYRAAKESQGDGE